MRLGADQNDAALITMVFFDFRLRRFCGHVPDAFDELLSTVMTGNSSSHDFSDYLLSPVLFAAPYVSWVVTAAYSGL
jgi:hypothetical protein